MFLMNDPSSLNVNESGKLISGESFTGFTLNVNSSLSDNSPSVTETLMDTSPLKFKDGIKDNSVPSTLT